MCLNTYLILFNQNAKTFFFYTIFKLIRLRKYKEGETKTQKQSNDWDMNRTIIIRV